MGESDENSLDGFCAACDKDSKGRFCKLMLDDEHDNKYLVPIGVCHGDEGCGFPEDCDATLEVRDESTASAPAKPKDADEDTEGKDADAEVKDADEEETTDEENKQPAVPVVGETAEEENKDQQPAAKDSGGEEAGEE